LTGRGRCPLAWGEALLPPRSARRREPPKFARDLQEGKTIKETVALLQAFEQSLTQRVDE
jgi:hypothetical protein